jgi:Endoribonuclease L-PSP
VAPYSAAVVAGGICFLAGAVAFDETGRLAGEGAGEQTERAVRNLLAALEAAGFARSDLAYVQLLLADIDDFAEVNAAYAAALGGPRSPREWPTRRWPCRSGRWSRCRGSRFARDIRAGTRRQIPPRGRTDIPHRDPVARRAGRRTATFVSGYPGSPLGGLDRELARQDRLLRELDIVHTPGLNEDLAATAVWGSQLAARLPRARFDGVLGAWYGKSPGIDRSADAIRHANMAGTGSLDGVVAFVGDDPTSKSSTVPNASEGALAELGMPVLYPGDVQDLLDLASMPSPAREPPGFGRPSR